MSNFTPLVRREYKFEGDSISITFARLKRKHMIRAMPALTNLIRLQAKDKEEPGDEEIDAVNDFLNVIVDDIPDYVHKVQGLNDAEGNAIGIETICEDFYFTKLAMRLAMDMVQDSSPTMEGN